MLLHRLRPPPRMAVLIGVTCLLLSLSGCVRIAIDMTIQSDDQVSGTIIAAVDDQVLAELGLKADETLRQSGLLSQYEVLGQSQDYQQDGYSGRIVTLSDVDLATFSGPAPDSLTIQRDGTEFVVTGKLDLRTGLSEVDPVTEEIPDWEEAWDFRLQLTFPGPVTESNGAHDGRVVSWHFQFGQIYDLRARASASDGGFDLRQRFNQLYKFFDTDSDWLRSAILAGSVLGLTAVLAVVLAIRQRRAGRASSATSADQVIVPAGPASGVEAVPGKTSIQTGSSPDPTAGSYQTGLAGPEEPGMCQANPPGPVTPPAVAGEWSPQLQANPAGPVTPPAVAGNPPGQAVSGAWLPQIQTSTPAPDAVSPFSQALREAAGSGGANPPAAGPNSPVSLRTRMAQAAQANYDEAAAAAAASLAAADESKDGPCPDRI